jgi:hypothetical protein
VRGLRTKSQEFFRNILNCNYDIICLTESWLNDSFYSAEYFDGSYDVFRCDRNPEASGQFRGGGVVIAVRRELCARDVSPAGDALRGRSAHSEELWVSVQLRDPSRISRASAALVAGPPNLLIVCSYVPHGVYHEYTLSSFYDQIINVIQARPTDSYLVLGDLNVTNAEWYHDSAINSLNIKFSNCPLVSLTKDFMNLSSLGQYNLEHNVNNRLLDLAFCSEYCNVIASKSPLVLEDRHHKALDIQLSLNIPIPLSNNNYIKKMFFKSDFVAIKTELQSIDWSNILLPMENVDTMVEFFYNTLNEIITKYVPSRNVTSTQRYPPWYTRPLIKLSKEKSKFHKKWKVYGNLTDYNTFAVLRKRLRKLERECYLNYNNYTEGKIKENPRFFWTYVKSKKLAPEIPHNMVYNDTVISEGSEICEAFNKYFHSVFVSTAQNYNTFHIENDQFNVDLGTIYLDTKVIHKALNNVNINKGAGYDEIHPILISRCSDELVSPIFIIFKKSIDTGTFPTMWKKSLVTPIPKNKEINLIIQYRPISKLSVFGKLFEKIVTAQLCYAIKNHISHTQHGFIKSRSVETNMITFTDFLLSAMDSDIQVDAVYTDFSKAFDKINHNLLIDKLYKMGIHGNLLRWIDSYIRNRSQAVCLKGYCSRFLHVPSGVPQGSHLGPVLFSLYINDMGDIFKDSSHLLYADDTKIYRCIATNADCLKLQSDIDALSRYCYNNQLFLNVDKCSVISYTRKRSPILFDYTLGNFPLKRVEIIRDLGIIMDSKVKFDIHIDTIISRAFKSLGFINRVSKPFNKVHSLKILYYSFVRSILDFACVVWHPHFKYHVNRIESVQKKFIKILNYRQCKKKSYEDSLSCHHLLTLSDRRKQFDLIFLHKLLNNNIDSSFLLSRINFRARIRLPLRSSRTMDIFVPPRFRKKYTQNNFFHRCLNMYNNEFSELDLFNSPLGTFKRKIIEKLHN